MQAPVIASIIGRFGVLTLNRPEALNALSLDMIRLFNAALLQWRDDERVEAVLFRSSSERAFCAGGDIRFFHRVATGGLQQGSPLLEDFFTEEYQLNHLIHCYPKPTVALMDGIVMGGGMGISQGTTLRVVTERTRMGMPEVSIGLFPDVGGGYFLSRAKGLLGFELALTGRIISASDALHAGLADHAVEAACLAEVEAVLAAAPAGSAFATLEEWITTRPGLSAPAPGPLAFNEQAIERLYQGERLPAILQALRQENSAYAQEALELISHRSPLMLCVTLEQLRRATTLDVAGCLRMERTMVRRCFEGGEVVEGIRARVIDKDNHPRWLHQGVEQVQENEVARFFESAWPASGHPLRDLIDVPQASSTMNSRR